MDPAHHPLTAPDDAALLDRLAAALARQGDPPITMRRMTVLDFQCATGEFMLRARVADALMRVSGHGRSQRPFRPPDDRLLAWGEMASDAAPFSVANRDQPSVTRPALLSHSAVMLQAGMGAPTLAVVP
jgi:hypothetical protein